MAGELCLPVIVARGTNYDVGYQMGSTFKSIIQETVDEKLEKDFDATQENDIYTTYLQVGQDAYPHYVRELQGIADGANVPFKSLFLKLLGPEIQSLSGDPPFKNKDSGEGCTDLILNSAEQAVIIHSEDVTPDMTKGYVVQAHILPSESNPIEEKFVAYCDPGMLPGNTFGANAHGLVVTGNILFQKGITSRNAIARKFVTRALLSSENLEDVIRTIKRPPGVGSAFNVNVAAKCKGGSEKPSFYSVEFAHSPEGSVVDVHEYGEGMSYHLNMYQRLKVDHFVDESSLHRSARIQELSTPQSMKDLLEIMSDTDNQTYPIFRAACPPDPYATSCIGAFDVMNDLLYVYRGNPKEYEYQPSAVFNIRNHIQELFSSFKP